MALTATHLIRTQSDIGPTSPMSTGTFAWLEGDMIVACAGEFAGEATSMTLLDVTLVRQGRAVISDGFDWAADLYAGVATSDQTTEALSAALAGGSFAIDLFVLRVRGSGGTLSIVSGSPTTDTGTSASGCVLAMPDRADSANMRIAFFMYGQGDVGTITPSSGLTALSEWHNDNGAGNNHGTYYNNTNNTDPQLSVSATDPSHWAAVGIEITEAASGHTFGGTSVEAAGEVGSGALTQNRVFAATGSEANGEVSSPALFQRNGFAATGVAANGEVSSGALTYAYVFGATSVEAAGDFPSGALTNRHVFTGTDAEANGEVSSPVLGQFNSFAATGVEGAVEVGSPALVNRHNFGGTSVEAASEVGTVGLVYGSDFIGLDVEAASEVGSGALTQLRFFSGSSVESASEVSSPALFQRNGFGATSVEAAGEVGSPALAHRSVFGATGVEGASEVGAGALLNRHVFTGSQVEAASAVGDAELAYGSGFGALAAEAASEVGSGVFFVRRTFAGTGAEAAGEVSSPALSQRRFFAGQDVASNSEAGIANLIRRILFAADSSVGNSEVGTPALVYQSGFGATGAVANSEVGTAPLSYAGQNTFGASGAEALSAVGSFALVYVSAESVDTYPIGNRYDSMIATAKRLIARFGQTVTWRALQSIENEEMPWRPLGTAFQNHKVEIAFLPLDRESKEYVREVISGSDGGTMLTGWFMGYMGATEFAPTKRDVVVRNGRQLKVESIDPIAPNGQTVLNKIIFRE